MKDIKNVSDLKFAIMVLEKEQKEKELLMREYFRDTYESLKPINLLKSTISDLFSSSVLIEKSINATIGIVAGSVSEKIFVGSSESTFRKLLGKFIQLAISNFVVQNPQMIKSVGDFFSNQDSEDNKEKTD